MGKKRKKIGIVFSWDESWAGGLYYLLNIINALNQLPDSNKPHLCIFDSNDRNIGSLQKINYPYISYHLSIRKLSIAERIINKISRLFTRLNLFSIENFSFVDFIFPLYSYKKDTFLDFYLTKKVFWIADFQHKRLPHFFSKEEIEMRDKDFRSIADEKVKLVLSSQDAKRDFETYFPDYKCEINVLSFAVTLDKFDHLDKSTILNKYDLKEGFFIAPNQFWVHKNHLIILKALNILKNKHKSIQIAFTGKQDDYRNTDHTTVLNQFIIDNDLIENVKLLGFIERADQLKLIYESIAVLQPSLFEGWSTVVEDSKALNKILILSDLKVHQEQCGENAIYFNPYNEQELAIKMEEIINSNNNINIIDYTEKQMKFGWDIYNTFD